MTKKESAATKRARLRGYFERDSSWYCEFRYTDVSGIGYEEGIYRRDPSRVILVDGTYYVYYSKSIGASKGFGTGDPMNKVFPWDLTEVWYATSTDGYDWKEESVAVPRGPEGRYDDRSVFTPDVLPYEGKYYLTYQCVKYPYVRRVKNTIGMAVADNPQGPFVPLDAPILSPTDDGQWNGDIDNRFDVIEKGSFDSHKVHDPVLIDFKGKFHLYYKGERMGEQLYMGGRETKWGVAIADNITGPYTKSEYNPITNSGHETCLWKYKDGIACMLSTDGMERNTIQFAEDGINFEIMGGIKGAPHAAGPYLKKDDSSPLAGLAWGLSFEGNNWNYIVRFDVDLTQVHDYNNHRMYE